MAEDTKLIQIRIPVQRWYELKAIADASGMHISDLVRRCVYQLLREQQERERRARQAQGATRQ